MKQTNKCYWKIEEYSRKHVCFHRFRKLFISKIGLFIRSPETDCYITKENFKTVFTFFVIQYKKQLIINFCEIKFNIFTQ